MSYYAVKVKNKLIKYLILSVISKILQLFSISVNAIKMFSMQKGWTSHNSPCPLPILISNLVLVRVLTQIAFISLIILSFLCCHNAMSEVLKVCNFQFISMHTYIISLSYKSHFIEILLKFSEFKGYKITKKERKLWIQ